MFVPAPALSQLRLPSYRRLFYIFACCHSLLNCVMLQPEAVWKFLESQEPHEKVMLAIQDVLEAGIKVLCPDTAPKFHFSKIPTYLQSIPCFQMLIKGVVCEPLIKATIDFGSTKNGVNGGCFHYI